MHTWQRPVLRAALQVRTGTRIRFRRPPRPFPLSCRHPAGTGSAAGSTRPRPSGRSAVLPGRHRPAPATFRPDRPVRPRRAGRRCADRRDGSSRRARSVRSARRGRAVGPALGSPPIRPSDRASVRTSAPRSAQSPPSPSPSGASPADRPAGLRLVNLRANLCVSPGDGTGAGVRLQACTDGDPQRWQFIGDGNGLYRIRNAADGRCLDGTTGGGDTVTVLLRDCRADHREQLWRLVADRSPTVFRIHLASPVASSGYADHLLGPGDIWPGPATYGSPLVHQPNYDNKEDFLFTTS
ncbi:RICIN domain-containing protein [Kitasatospora aburaviensis]